MPPFIDHFDKQYIRKGAFALAHARWQCTTTTATFGERSAQSSRTWFRANIGEHDKSFQARSLWSRTSDVLKTRRHARPRLLTQSKTLRGQHPATTPRCQPLPGSTHPQETFADTLLHPSTLNKCILVSQCQHACAQRRSNKASYWPAPS